MITAIYDRTERDITDNTAKGQFNIDDANRLETNIKTVADCFAVPFVQKTWIDRSEIPRVSDYLRWKTALDLIKTAYNVLQPSPERPYNTWQKWNQIEYLLWYTEKIYTDNIAQQSYCGELVS